MQKQDTYYRFYFFTKLREPISALTHAAGLAAALGGLPFLLALAQDRPAWLAALLVYGVSLCLLFLASTVYHAVSAGPEMIQILRKLDHSAIYLLIAGTYTPFCVIAFTGFWQTGFLALIWGLALAGIAAKAFIIHSPRWLTAGIYVVMGWLSVFAAREMLAVLPGNAIAWLLAGGLAYTLGALVYSTKKMDFFPGVFGFHEVWHLFVLLGAAAHFIAVLQLMQFVS